MWFGTRGHERWVRDPSRGMGASPVGVSSQTGQLGGGFGVRNSVGSHLEYSMAWNFADRDTIRQITDFADGVFGTGLIYFIDPMAVDKNVLPQGWATPSQGCYDGPLLVKSTTPVIAATAANSHGFPAESAVYTLTADSVPVSLYVPIPDGATLQVGFVGSATGSAVVTATDASGTTDLTLLAVTDTALTNAAFTGWVEFALSGVGDITLTAATAVLADAATSGVWVSGQGNSGCRFDRASVQVTDYNSALDLQGLTATLFEVGSWEW